MSHGSEGSKGQTRHRYLQWMEKEPRTKSEMAAYQKDAGKVGIETTSSQRGGSKPTQQDRQYPITQTPGGYRVVKPTRRIPQEDVAEKKELVKEKPSSQLRWPEWGGEDIDDDIPTMMEMPRITNLRRERG